MFADADKIEEQLRSQLYTALVELSFAPPDQKAAIVERMMTACRELTDLIINCKTPEM
jgi:hypothetical protein